MVEMPKSHSFHLAYPGLPELSGMARDFLKGVIAFADFEGSEGTALCDAVCSTLAFVEGAVENQRDVELPIDLTVTVDASSIEIAILEHGVPIGSESKLVQTAQKFKEVMQVFDEVSWKQRGTEGSELRLRRQRSHPEITTIVKVEQRLLEHSPEHPGDIENFPQDGAYTIRPFCPDDALQISRCVYESYGRSYANGDLYYPDRIIALNDSGELISIVAEAPDGSVVGHCALERPGLKPIGEVGVAVVDPDHRGKGLFKTMRKGVVEQAQKRGMRGTWSQPVTRHPYSQRMDISAGATACGLSLSVTPPSTVLRANSEEVGDKRFSCFLYWQSIGSESPIKVSVPEDMAPIIETIYQGRGRAITIDTDCDVSLADEAQSSKHVHTRFDRQRKLARLQFDQVNANALSLAREAMQVLEDNAGAEAIFVEIPIADPGCATLASQLLNDGLIFSGVGPYFLGEDALRLQRLIAPVELDGLAIEGDLAGQIAEYVLTAARA